MPARSRTWPPQAGVQFFSEAFGYKGSGVVEAFGRWIELHKQRQTDGPKGLPISLFSVDELDDDERMIRRETFEPTAWVSSARRGPRSCETAGRSAQVRMKP